MRAGTLNERRARLGIKIRAIKYPRAYGQWMFCLHLTVLYRQPQRSSTDTHETRRLRKIHPSLAGGLFSAVDRDFMMTA